MNKKYGIFIIILIIILAGTAVTFLNRFYSFDYLYNSLIRREFSINPKAEIVAENEYKIRIWYYPFYRTINNKEEKDFFKMVQKGVIEDYSNIKLVVGKLSFKNGHNQLMKAIEDGNPPDIYFNLTDYNFIDEQLQIPVNQYINSREQEGFYTVDWNRVNYRDQLWGWPLLVQNHYWLAGKNVNINTNQGSFVNRINNLEKSSLVLNYPDLILLKQLLTVMGLNAFKVEKNELDIDTYRALEDVFVWLNFLRQEEILYEKETTMPDIFLKELMEKKSVVIGPVNPFLARFIEKKMKDQIKQVMLNNMVKTYSLNVFRQKRYKGDDHTRAAMEVARIIANKYSSELATELELDPAFMEVEEKITEPQFREVLEIGPEQKKYWEKVVVPAWFEFWEKGLTPAEVMRRFR